MKKQSVIYNDLKVLSQLFLGHESSLTLIDPNNLVLEKVAFENVIHPYKVLANFSNDVHALKEIELFTYDLVLDFSSSLKVKNQHSKRFQFIKNPDGQIRWLFQGNRIAEVLPFYNNSTIRSKTLAFLIKTANALGVSKLFADGCLNVISHAPYQFENKVNQMGDGYSIFLGTPGFQRSCLLAIFNKSKLSQFLKIPVSNESEELLIKENQAITKAKQLNIEEVVIPEAIYINEEKFLFTENVNNAKRKKVNRFEYLHANVVAQYLKKSCTWEKLKETAFWKELNQDIQVLRFNEAEEISSLAELSHQLVLSINDSQKVLTHFAHGDFTPWNILADKQKLFVYDWELSQAQAPAFYDLFHFHYQKGILVDRSSLVEIRKQIDYAFDFWPIASLVQEFKLKIDLYHKLYLLKSISYFLKIFSQQSLSTQNNWQLNAWRKALKREVFKAIQQNKSNCRKRFLLDFNRYLSSYAHAYLKFDYPSLEKLPTKSDLDLAIQKEDFHDILYYIKNYPSVNRYKVVAKSFMYTVEVHFDDASFLSFDFLFKFRRKELSMFNINTLLENSKLSTKGVKVPTVQDDLAYALAFYVLNGSQLPERYQAFFKLSDEMLKHGVLNYINQTFGTAYPTYENMLKNGLSQRALMVTSLRNRSKSSLLKGYYNYLSDSLRSIRFTNGFIVTFSGVDGVGKSTIIKLVKENIEETYRKEVVQLRHRPGLFPILSSVKHGKKKAEEIASVTIPRKGRNKSQLSSILRFAYYFCDYFFGQIYVYFRYVLRGKVVLYDRYYFDFINDAKRSNIEMNPMIAKALYRLVMKPRLNVFLYAEPEVILKRKQELNAQDIKQLNKRYKTLFEEFEKKSLKSTYRAIENNELSLTINNILREFGRVA